MTYPVASVAVVAFLLFALPNSSSAAAFVPTSTCSSPLIRHHHRQQKRQPRAYDRLDDGLQKRMTTTTIARQYSNNDAHNMPLGSSYSEDVMRFWYVVVLRVCCLEEHR